MDFKIEKKPWYFRYRYYLIGAAAIVILSAYALTLAFGPKRLRMKAESLSIAEVVDGKFLEYVDAEGIVHPILTLKVNALESGFVERIVAEEGSMLKQGDTILVLNNPELMRTISDEQDEWERQQRLQQEQKIEMEQKTLTLKQQALDAAYELGNINDKQRIAQEEYNMGIISRAELDIAKNEYEYKKHKTALQMQNIKEDSTASILRLELLHGDIERARTKRDRALSRSENLVVRAPIDGQLSYLNFTPGEQVQAGQSIGEVKKLSDYKLRVNLNEYYIDRITTGLEASITQQGHRYPLRVSRVVPEVKDRSFGADLVFADEKPSNVRVGKSFRVQIELGQPEDALVISRGDFYNVTGGRWIYKLDPSGTKAVKTEIVIGRQNPRQYEIISGLNPGDRVIINGYEKFADSQEIILE